MGMQRACMMLAKIVEYYIGLITNFIKVPSSPIVKSTLYFDTVFLS